MQQGLQQGLQQGRREGERAGLLAAIELGLELKFGDAGLRLYPEIAAIEDTARLKAILDKVKSAAAAEEVQRFYREW